MGINIEKSFKSFLKLVIKTNSIILYNLYQTFGNYLETLSSGELGFAKTAF